MKTILFPTDFSHYGDAALDLATSLARDHGAKLLIVHVQEPSPAYGGGEMYYGMALPDTDEIKNMISAVKPADPEVPFEHRIIQGTPASSIVRLANSESVDMIVMGTHGRTGLSRMLMGSVAEAVVRKAPCPVFTFKTPAKDLASTE